MTDHDGVASRRGVLAGAAFGLAQSPVEQVRALKNADIRGRAVSGTDLLFRSAGRGAVSRALNDKLQDVCSLFDFIPPALHRGIKAGTLDDYDATDALYAAWNQSPDPVLPEGKFYIAATIIQDRVGLRGVGPARMDDAGRYLGGSMIVPIGEKTVFRFDGQRAGRILAGGAWRDFSIVGDQRRIFRSATAFEMAATADDTRGIDKLLFDRIAVQFMKEGFKCSGRSIWNTFNDVEVSFCNYGVDAEARASVNQWKFNGGMFASCHRSGLRAIGTGAPAPWYGWSFHNHTSEGHGDQSGADGIYYGYYAQDIANWSWTGAVDMENIGSRPGQTGYGIFLTGQVARGMTINGVQASHVGTAVFSNALDGSGTISNLSSLGSNETAIRISGTYDVSRPKWLIDRNSVRGAIDNIQDVNGNYPAAFTDGIQLDWDGVGSAVQDMTYRQGVSVNTRMNVTIRDIIGLEPGLKRTFAAAGVNALAISGSLMVNGKPHAIPPGEAHTFLVTGYPSARKLQRVAG